MALANGVKHVWIGQNGLLSTPAVSAIIRERDGGIATGGIILTASHNPGGPNADFGVKYNIANGGPAPSSVTNKIFELTKTIKEYRICNGMPEIDLSKAAAHHFSVGGEDRVVEVIDSCDDYVSLLKSKVFNFSALKTFLARDDFSFVYDGLSGVAGPYARRIFNE